MTPIFLKVHRFFKKNILVFVLLLLTVLLLGTYSLTHLHLEEDISDVLPKDGDLARFEKLIEKTSTGNKLIFVLRSDQQDINALVDAGNNLQNSLQETLPDSLISAYGIINDESAFLDLLNEIYRNLGSYLGPEDLNSLDLSQEVLRPKISKKLKVLFTPAGSMMKQSITNDPLDLGTLALKHMQSLQVDNNFEIVNSCLISKDSTYLLGFLALDPRINENKQKKLLHEVVTTSLKELNASSSVKHYVFGAAIISEENAQRIKMDIMLTINIAVTLLLIGMAFYYQSIKVLPGFIIPIILGASVALSFLFIQQDFVSAISLGMGSVLLGTIIDYSLHILTHLRKTGDAEATVKHTTSPIIAGCITTSTAFLCLLLINSKALTDLAIFAAASMVFGALFAILVLPIIYKNSFKGVAFKQNFVDRFISYPFHQNKGIIAFCFVIVVLGAFFIKNIDFTKDLNELNYMPSYISEAEEELHLASNALQSNLIVIIEKDNLNEVLLATERLEDELKNEIISGKIDEIKSVSGILASEQKLKERAAFWENFWTQDKIENVKEILYSEAEKLGIQQEAFSPFIQQLEQSKSNLSIQTNALTENYVNFNEEDSTYLSTVVVKLDKENKGVISQVIQSLDADFSVIDKSNMVYGLILQVKSSLKKISCLLLGLILLILFFYFRRFELVLLAFFPVFLSWITTLGLMGLFHIPFNMLNIIIVIFIFGLGIDYAIFILNALVQDYERGEKHFLTVKSSVLLSAFTTFVGIGVLYFAKHPALHSIALAGVIAIVSVFIYAIVVLPFLFQNIVIKRAESRFDPITFSVVKDTIIAYGALVFGTVIITSVGFLMHLLFFIPIHKRKYFFHQVFNFWAKAYVWVLFPKDRFISNESKEDFNKPSIIIANHQSLIDTPVMLSLHPKIILLTKDWVRNSPLFGLGSRLADFYSVEGDQEEMIKSLKQKVKEGYSVAIFPEGTRSLSRNMIRFYRGAFILSEQLKLDIVPVMIHGTIETLHKKQFFGQRRQLHLKIMDRILYSDKSYGENSRERYKRVRDYFKKSYNLRRKVVETGDYFEKHIIANYNYKTSSLQREIKSTLSKFNNFIDLQPSFLNDKKTLIIDHSKGVLTLAQNLCNESKKIWVQSPFEDIIRNCYLVSDKNIYVSDLTDIQEEFDQILYIGFEKIDSDLFKDIRSKNCNFIFLNLKNGQIESPDKN